RFSTFDFKGYIIQCPKWIVFALPIRAVLLEHPGQCLSKRTVALALGADLEHFAEVLNSYCNVGHDQWSVVSRQSSVVSRQSSVVSRSWHLPFRLDPQSFFPSGGSR